jgi:hypothetical protein
MVPVSLAVIGLVQLLAIFALERTTVLRHLSRRVFLEEKDEFPDIKDLFGDTSETVKAQTEDVLRVTDLISGLFGSALNLVVGTAIAIAIGVIGSQTHQRPGWMVILAYVAGGICLASLVLLLVMILRGKVQDHAGWKRVPDSKVCKWIRNAISPRTPDLYKLIVLVTSAYLLVISSQYVDPAQVVH